MLYHYPIQNKSDDARMIEFCHIHSIHRKNAWNPDHKIKLTNCKINIFMKGDFSVVVGEQVFSPVYGDTCFLGPLEQHYGRIPKESELDYFQLDIGIEAFDGIPDGKKLLANLIDRRSNTKVFARPSKSDSKMLIDICYRIEESIENENNNALAFANVVQLIVLLEKVYRDSSQPEPSVLSKNAAFVVRYIESHYNEEVSINMLAGLCGVSESWLSRSFHAEMGETIHNHLIRCRLVNSLEHLKSNSVSDVSFMCGFSDSSHFISQFKRFFGYTPMEYKKRKSKKKIAL